MTRYRIVNLDHLNTLPGGQGEPHDRAVVLDEHARQPHPLTGRPQPQVVFTGTLRAAHAFLAAKEQAR
jgi:hypothetical protein